MRDLLMRTAFSFAAIMALPALLSIFIPPSGINEMYTVRGSFDATFRKLNSIVKLDSAINVFVGNGSTYPEVADSILKLRFYHGTCRYEFCENWAAFVLGALIWDDFRMKTISDDIIKGEVAVCNQVNIVFQELLRKNAMRFRTVGFRHHLATEVFFEGRWQLFDSDYEPSLSGRPSAEELVADSVRFMKMYSETQGRKFNPHFDEVLKTRKVMYGDEGSRLAGNLSLFQKTLGILSSFGWLAFLIPALLLKYF